jgi:hypothetical protein
MPAASQMRTLSGRPQPCDTADWRLNSRNSLREGAAEVSATSMRILGSALGFPVLAHEW